MIKVALSPCLMYFDNDADNIDKHYALLSDTINFIFNNFQKTMEFDYYCGAPYENYTINPPDYKMSLHFFSQINQLFSRVQLMVSKDQINLDNYTEVCPMDNYKLPEIDYSHTFLKYINYILKNKKDSILFLGKPNYTLNTPVKFKEGILPAVKNIKNELYKEFNDLYAVDCTDEIFPKKEACRKANAIVLKKCNKISKEEKRAIYIKYGRLIAGRNNFIYDTKLSQLNSKIQKQERKIYKSSSKPIFYLSLDFESGGFEVFDKNCKHLGQYNFSCDKVKKSDPNNHKLYLK